MSCRVIRNSKEKKAKEKGQKIDVSKPGVPPGGKLGQSIDRKNLHNFRVVQRNLVYIIGLPSSIGAEDALRKPEYFGQYGKIGKIVIHKNNLGGGHMSPSTVSAYITFVHKEDAKASIHSLDGHFMEGHQLRASFGTTKYCNSFIRGLSCNNPECVYLHELGSEEDRFTKAEIQAGHTKLNPVPGANQHVVTGMGGPSGTGKRPTGTPILPAPVFLADLPGGATAAAPAGDKGAAATSSKDAAGGAKKSSGPATNAWPLAANKVVSGDAHAKSTKDDGNPSTDNVKASADDSRDDTRSPFVSEQDRDNEGDLSKVAQSKSSAGQNGGGPGAKELAQQVLSASFNGLGRCAVFTVPVSSLSRNSLWSGILDVSTTTAKPSLTTNPYGAMQVPVSELFDLTLPPVDAVGMNVWPKPASYYAPSHSQQPLSMQQQQQQQAPAAAGGGARRGRGGRA